MDASTMADQPLRELLARFAARSPAPGGGSGAAVTCAVAASLLEMAAAYERGAAGAPEAAAEPASEAGLCERGLDLAEADLRSYEPVLAALRLPAGDETRAARLADALAAAAAVPLAIAGLAAEIAELAAGAAARAGRHLVGDAAAAAVLAEGACAAAARLVALNVGDAPADPRVARATELAAQAARARQRALN
ncbi:MAG: cyclodeaminase/cyclohydrolase family protein [Solirubrobacteraceae bacterium]|jgi:formiminotetrahydrofolate cyclodeaminase